LRLALFRLFDRGLAGLVFRVQCDGSINACLLPALRATTEQDDESVAVLSKIDPKDPLRALHCWILELPFPL
jgi:hypothetical protein